MESTSYHVTTFAGGDPPNSLSQDKPPTHLPMRDVEAQLSSSQYCLGLEVRQTSHPSTGNARDEIGWPADVSSAASRRSLKCDRSMSIHIAASSPRSSVPAAKQYSPLKVSSERCQLLFMSSPSRKAFRGGRSRDSC